MYPPSLFSNYAVKVGEIAIAARTAELQAAIADKNIPEMKRLVREIETFEHQISEHKASMARDASASRGGRSAPAQREGRGDGPDQGCASRPGEHPAACLRAPATT